MKSAKSLVLAAVILGALLVGGYLTYDFFFRPVRVVSVWQFKLEQGAKIKKLQEGGLAAWPEAKIYLLDVRTRDSYQKGHIVGSASLPANRAKEESHPINGVLIIVYSSEFGLDSAREVADAIVQNGKSGRLVYENPGKIYVVKDGFEGLKKAGLATEIGEWD